MIMTALIKTKKSELHFDKAVEVMEMGIASNTSQKTRLVHYYPGYSGEMLCRYQYFEYKKICTMYGFPFSVLDTSFQFLLCLASEGGLEAETDKAVRFAKKTAFSFLSESGDVMYLVKLKY